MSKAAMTTAIILGIVGIMALWIVGNYNSLVGSRNAVDKSWASVETQYQKRLDLVDNLVSSVKGAQQQEKDVFGKIAESRQVFQNPESTSNEQAAAASNIESQVIALLPRLQEAYPDLKSNQQVQDLMNQIRGTEDGILKARDTYNTTVNNYNTQIQKFPKNMFANTFGFETRTLFKSEAAAATAPKVKF